jgi:hypothetical protein
MIIVSFITSMNQLPINSKEKETNKDKKVKKTNNKMKTKKMIMMQYIKLNRLKRKEYEQFIRTIATKVLQNKKISISLIYYYFFICISCFNTHRMLPYN